MIRYEYHDGHDALAKMYFAILMYPPTLVIFMNLTKHSPREMHLSKTCDEETKGGYGQPNYWANGNNHDACDQDSAGSNQWSTVLLVVLHYFNKLMLILNIPCETTKLAMM